MYCHILKGAAVLGAITLTACGGGGSSSGGGSAPSGGNGTKAPSYNSLLGQIEDFNDRYELDDPTAYDNVTTSAEMPVSGKATYSGAGIYRPLSTPKSAPPPIVGKATMNANFGKGTVSGRVTDLKASPGNRTSGGTIKMEGVIRDIAVDAAVNGNLDLNGKTHKFSNKALGVFYGRDAEGLAVVSAGKNWDGEDYVVTISGTE